MITPLRLQIMKLGNPQELGQIASPKLLVRLAVVLAIVIAFLEIVVRLAFLYFRRTPFGAGSDILWMAPAMNLIWFGGAVVLVMAGQRLLPRLFVPAVAYSLILTPAFVTVTWLIPGVHLEAAFLLGIGLAVQSSRLLLRRRAFLDWFTHRALMPLVLGTGLLILACTGWQRLREERAMAALPSPPASTPNVLLLLLDTVRSYSLSAYGYERPTSPMLERLVQNGVRFDRAFAPASWTLPSHATLFTARWPFELRTGPKRPLKSDYPTLAEALARSGMATGGFAANHYYLTWEHGLTRGFIRFEGYPAGLPMFFTSTAIGRTLMEYNTFRKPFEFYDSPKRKTARMVNDQFLDWVDDLDGRPFFAFLNYFDAHYPYLPPEPYLTRFGPHGKLRWLGHTPDFDEVPSREIPLKNNQYDGAIAYLDAEIEHVLTRLDERGLLDNTIVVITSDHGEHWGDHERLAHANSLYRQVLQVPLLISAPNAGAPGTRVSDPVSLRDLPSTILELTGIPNTARFPGGPLRSRTNADPSAAPSPAFSEDAPFGMPGARSLVDRGLHYIRLHNGNEQLYDIERDSLEVRDLSADAAYAPALAELRAKMQALTRNSPPSDIN